MKRSFTPLEIISTNKRNRKFLTGFTLIELLIVLVIIGVLATLAVPQYQKFVIRSRVAEAMTNLRTLSDSLWRYYIETGTFPIEGGISNLDVKITNPSRYFQYDYIPSGSVPGSIAEFLLWAVDIDVETNQKFGAVVTYCIMYTKDPLSHGDEYDWQKLDNIWYLTYFHAVITPGGYDYRRGWP